MVEVHTIDSAVHPRLADVRRLLGDYWNSLGFTPCFQGFEEELAELPGKYAPPEGRLLLLTVDGNAAATGAFRPIEGPACEIKRVYVDPAFRRRGLARKILASLMEDARREGYAEAFADTMPSMEDALELYRAQGFAETEPYSGEPTPGAVYLRLGL